MTNKLLISKGYIVITSLRKDTTALLSKMDILLVCVFLFALLDVTALEISSAREEEKNDFSWAIASRSDSVQTRWDINAHKDEEMRKLTKQYGNSSVQTPSYVQNERKTIVGGAFSPIHRFPYIVTVQFNKTGNHSHTCGASLIAPDFILTAAHCYSPCDSTNNIKVIVGDHDLTNETDGGEAFDIKAIIIHPQYDNFFTIHDIMLFQLSGYSTKTPVRLNKNINIPTDWQEVDVIGWGAVDPNGTQISDILKEVTLEVVPNDKCFLPSSTIPYGNEIVCAVDVDDIADEYVCAGDSGGPLIVRGSNYTEDIQVALVSKGPVPCAQEGVPGQHSRISFYHQWITEIVCKSSVAAPSDFDCPIQTPLSPEPASTSTTLPTTKKISVTLVIRLDSFPQEVSWTLYDGTELEVSQNPNAIYTKKSYPQDYANTFAYEDLYLEPDKQYVFSIGDCFGDGICCENGEGYYFLHWGHKKQNFQDELKLFEDTGDFGNVMFVPFNTTNKPVQTDSPATLSPTAAPKTMPPVAAPTTMSPTAAPTKILPTAVPSPKKYLNSEDTKSSFSLSAFINPNLIPIVCIINGLFPVFLF